MVAAEVANMVRGKRARLRALFNYISKRVMILRRYSKLASGRLGVIGMIAKLLESLYGLLLENIKHYIKVMNNYNLFLIHT